MDIDKMIADYSSSLMAQARRWRKISDRDEPPQEEPTSEDVDKLEDTVYTADSADTPEEKQVPEQEEKPNTAEKEVEKDMLIGEFYAKTVAGVYPISGAKISLKCDGELIYLLTTGENGETDRVSFLPCENKEYAVDIFAEGFEGKRDVPVDIVDSSVFMTFELIPIPSEE